MYSFNAVFRKDLRSLNTRFPKKYSIGFGRGHSLPLPPAAFLEVIIRQDRMVLTRKSKTVSLGSLFALEGVNKYFRRINSDVNYKAPCYVHVPQGTRLHVIDEFTTFKFLSQHKRTAAGPDGPSH